MAKAPRKSSSSNRSDHMANERTFLAWIRTSLGVMAFGFVVEKFALFVKQFGYFLASQNAPQPPIVSPTHQTLSSIFGMGLVAVGALIGLFSFIKYKQTEKHIEDNTYKYSSVLASALTALVVVIGIFLVVYLGSTK